MINCHLKHDLLVYVESLHGGEEDSEGGELGNVEHHHVLLRLLAGALGVRAQARSLYHNLRDEVRIRQGTENDNLFDICIK